MYLMGFLEVDAKPMYHPECSLVSPAVLAKRFTRSRPKNLPGVLLGFVALPREVADDRRIPHQEPRQLQGLDSQDAQDSIPAGLGALRAAADGAAGLPGASGGEAKSAKG